MSRTDRSAEEKPFTGKHMLACMLGFFGVIVAVNIAMASLASFSWTGLVVKNSYVASQKFNDHLKAGREQAALGWRSDLSYADGTIRFELTDQTGIPIHADSVSVQIGRPATETSDEVISLEHKENGRFVAPQTLAAGQWDLRATAQVGDRAYIRDTRVHVRQSKASSSEAMTQPVNATVRQ